MRKPFRLLCSCFLLLPLVALNFASAQTQLVRFGPYELPSVSNLYPPLLQANIPPNSPVLSVCHSPANNGAAHACTNYATTYTGTGTACPNGAQDTPDPGAGTASCQVTGDAQGNLGWWAPPGEYDFTACVGTTCFGPYTVTAGTGVVPGSAHIPCETGIGDGLNAIPAGTYLQAFCRNDSGAPLTISGIWCFTDNAGSSSTMNASGHTLGSLLTGAITCSPSFAAGTQSANITLLSGAGTVNTNGTAVTLISGTLFNALWSGAITIHGVTYTISAVNSSTSITLTGSAGTQTGVSYQWADWINFTFVSDGTSKQTTWGISF